MSRRPHVRWWQLATLGVQVILLLLSMEWVALGERRESLVLLLAAQAGLVLLALLVQRLPQGHRLERPTARRRPPRSRGRHRRRRPLTHRRCTRRDGRELRRDLVETADHDTADTDGRPFGEGRLGECAPVGELRLHALSDRGGVGIFRQTEPNVGGRARTADDELRVGRILRRPTAGLPTCAVASSESSRRVCAVEEMRSMPARTSSTPSRGLSRSSFSRASSTPRSFSVVARVRNWSRTRRRISTSPLCRHHRLCQLGRAAHATPDERGRQAHAEDPEPAQQRPRSATLSVVASESPREAVCRDEEAFPFGAIESGQFAEGGVLALAQGAGALGDESCDGDDGRARAKRGRRRARSVGDLAGRQQRVDAPRPDLVGPRQHPDGVDRLRGAGRGVVERLEEPDVGRRAGAASGR